MTDVMCADRGRRSPRRRVNDRRLVGGLLEHKLYYSSDDKLSGCRNPGNWGKLCSRMAIDATSRCGYWIVVNC